MQRMGAMLGFDSDRTCFEMITANLSDEDHAVHAKLGRTPTATFIAAQPPALLLLGCAMPDPHVAGSFAVDTIGNDSWRSGARL